jgi:glycosyltransferase involved in cell wall biosynthesis
MHVLYLIDSLGRGGSESSLAAMAPHLIARGIQLDVAYLHEREGVGEELEAGGAKVFSLAGRGGRIRWARLATGLLRSRHPALVHTTLFESDVVGRIAARLSSVPVVTSLVNEAYGSEHFSDPGLKRWKVRLAQAADAATAQLAVRFHAVSEPVAAVMARRLHVALDRVDVIPRGRDTVRLGVRTIERRRQVRAALGLAPDTSLVFAAARQEHQKGLDVLIESFPAVLERLPSSRLLIAGREGDASLRLRGAVAGLKLENFVHFLGVRADVPDLLCAADVMVLPSRREGLPGIVLEALALEAPIVATDIPTTRDALAGEHGRLVPAECASGLADAIVATLRDPLAREKARRGRLFFLDRFQIERVADRMVGFYEIAAAGPRSNSRPMVGGHRNRP